MTTHPSKTNQSSTAGDTRAPNPSGGRRALGIVLWIVQALVALNFAFAGISKLIGDQMQVDMFTTLGAEPWLRLVVGVCEIAGAVGLLIPRLTPLAAACLSLLMIGAVISTLAVIGGSVVLPLVLAVVTATIAVLRFRMRRNRPATP
ncbi:DoxX family protein [Microlunatus sp. Y2014]|uniref:DoxX family protein n=1 Tax=Microlunatus sp. Y2014 TaxID=3418488 RepID=UPI003DA75E20